MRLCIVVAFLKYRAFGNTDRFQEFFLCLDLLCGRLAVREVEGSVRWQARRVVAPLLALTLSCHDCIVPGEQRKTKTPMSLDMGVFVVYGQARRGEVPCALACPG